MFARVLDAVRADTDRQIGWTKDQVRRQTRYTARIGALAGVAALAGLGAIVVGLVYLWLSMQTSVFVALGVIGGGLLLWLSSGGVRGSLRGRGCTIHGPARELDARRIPE